MKITVFNGSPQGEKGNTHFMVKEFMEGAKEAGAEVENIFLVQKNIHYCMGCFACWLKTPGKCAIKDDMEELLEKYLKSDIIVFACPMYYSSVSGLMKNFIDRTLPLADPHMEKDKNGNYRHPGRYDKSPKLVLISNSGFPEQGHFKYFRSIFDYLEEKSESKIIAEIYRGGGAILAMDTSKLNMIEKLFIDNILGGYKKLLRKAGKEVAENLKLSEKTKAELEKPLFPADKYIEQANKHWDKTLAQVK